MLSSFPNTPELLAIAKRIVWFASPEETLKDPKKFLAYLMTYGFHEDIEEVKKYTTSDDFIYALEHAPPGIFDPRSWNYWNLVYNRLPIPPLPERNFNTDENNGVNQK